MQEHETLSQWRLGTGLSTPTLGKVPREHQHGRAEAMASGSKTGWAGHLTTALREPVFITPQVSGLAGNGYTALASALRKAESAGRPQFSGQRGSFYSWGPVLFQGLLMVPSKCFHSPLPSPPQQGKERGLVATSPFPRWLCQAASVSSRLPFLGLSQLKSMERLRFLTPTPSYFWKLWAPPSRKLPSSPR